MPGEMTMVERVGRAMAEVDGEDYVENAKMYDRYARAAIEEMRNTTNAMDVAGWKKVEERGAILGNGEVAMVWRAMIDQALSDSPPLRTGAGRNEG